MSIGKDFFMENKSLFVNEKDYREEILVLFQSDISDELKREKLDDYHDNDIAVVFEELDTEDRERFADLLGSEKMSVILTYLDDAGEYISELDANEAADIIEQMDADEALDVLDSLEEDTRSSVLELIEDEVREEIELLESYSEDEFGSKMSMNFISVKRGATIKAAMRSLISQAAEKDNISTIFVTDENDVFYGAFSLKDLIVARSTDDPDDIIYTAFPYVCDKDLISENIEKVRGYSEELIPVVSSEDKRLLGVITSNDMIDIVDEELGDDYAKLAALTEEEEESDSLLRSMAKRVPWLTALLFMGLLVSMVVGMFEGLVEELPLIVSFQSLILGMAGNVGTQSLAVTVRSLGVSESFGFKKQLLLIFKETRVALLNGVALGLLSFALVGAYLALFTECTVGFAMAVSGCVGGAMCFAMMISGFTGAAIPMCLYRLGADPAVASGPLITTVNDLVAVISYYGLAWLLLLQLV